MNLNIGNHMKILTWLVAKSVYYCSLKSLKVNITQKSFIVLCVSFGEDKNRIVYITPTGTDWLNWVHFYFTFRVSYFGITLYIHSFCFSAGDNNIITQKKNIILRKIVNKIDLHLQLICFTLFIR